MQFNSTAQLLPHLVVTAVNFKKTWDTSVSRCDIKKIILNTTLNRLITRKKIARYCPISIKELPDTASECLYSLGNIKIHPKSLFIKSTIYAIMQ